MIILIFIISLLGWRATTLVWASALWMARGTLLERRRSAWRIKSNNETTSYIWKMINNDFRTRWSSKVQKGKIWKMINNDLWTRWSSPCSQWARRWSMPSRWTSSEGTCFYPARVRSARARRACALRALGLLLADGAPTVGRGKTFWWSTKFFSKNCCNSGTESRKFDSKVGN